MYRAFIFAVFSIAGISVIHSEDYGLYTLVLNSALLKCEFNKSVTRNVSELKIYFYDFLNDINESYYLSEASSYFLSKYNSSRNLLVYVPGFTETINSSNQDIVRQNMKGSPEIYLLIMDHHPYTYRSLDYIGSYERSVRYYWSIGAAIADFLIEIVDGGVSLASIHVMGHSLGGQIIGAVGESFINKTGKKIPKITGSDSAGPCFSKAGEENQLRKGLGGFVQAYLCNAGTLGTNNQLTDAYYFVNGGSAQPGCSDLGILNQLLVLQASQAASCSHNFCVNVVTLPASVQGIWKACSCNSETNCENGVCSSGDTTIAGIYSSSDNTGGYYFNTTS